jgi:hypothetical protein
LPRWKKLCVSQGSFDLGQASIEIEENDQAPLELIEKVADEQLSVVHRREVHDVVEDRRLSSLVGGNLAARLRLARFAVALMLR